MQPLSRDALLTASLKRCPDTNLFSAGSLPGVLGGRMLVKDARLNPGDEFRQVADHGLLQAGSKLV